MFEASSLLSSVPAEYEIAFSTQVDAKNTHIYGATKERTSVQSFPQDHVEVFGSLRHVNELSHSPGEVLHSLQGVPSF